MKMNNIKAVLFDLNVTLVPSIFQSDRRLENVKQIIAKIKRAEYKVGIVSNCTHREVLKKVEELGIGGFIDVIATPKNEYEKKPRRKIFFKAMEKLDIKPSQTLFVGDHLFYDIFGARLCGMKTMLIKKNFKTYHKLIFRFKSILGPDFFANNLREVLDVLRQL